MNGAGNWSTARVQGQAGGSRRTVCYSPVCGMVSRGEWPRCPSCGGQVSWRG